MHHSEQNISTPPEHLLKKASVVAAEGNHPFLINGHHRVRIVKKGTVDLFVVKVENSEPHGRRRYLCTLKEGELLPGFAINETGLLAVGTMDAELYEFSVEEFWNQLTEEAEQWLAHSLDAWIEKISARIGRNRVQRTDIELRPGTKYQLRENQTIKAEKKVVWFTESEIEGFYMGAEPINTESDAHIPLSSQLYVSITNDVECSPISTKEFLRNEGIIAVKNGIIRFHEMMILCERINQQLGKTDEQQRLRARYEATAQMQGQALTQIARPIDLESDLDIEFEVDSVYQTHPVFKTWAWLAASIHFDISPHPILKKKDTEQRYQVKRMADVCSARLRSIELQGAWWEEDSGPMIAFARDDGRPLALMQEATGSYICYDSTHDEIWPVNSDQADLFDKKAEMVLRTFSQSAVDGWSLFKFGIKGMGGDVKRLIVVGILGGILGLIIPVATGFIFDKAIPMADRPMLYEITAGLIVGSVSIFLFNLIRGFSMLRVEGKLDYNMQAAVWDRLLKLPATFFRKFSTGDLSGRVTSINRMRETISGPVINTLLSSFFSLFQFFILFYYSPVLALVATGLVLLLIAVLVYSAIRDITLVRQQYELNGKLSTLVYQMLNGIGKLRVAGAEKRAFANWANLYNKVRRIIYSSGKVTNNLTVFNQTYQVISLAAIFIGVFYLIREDVTTGSFLAFISAFSIFMNAMMDVGNALISFVNVIPLYERAEPVLKAHVESSEASSTPDRLSGEIEITGLNFRYHEHQPLVLKNINLNIKPGEFVAIVGPSGSGKSTLLRCLLGFEQPENGSVFYDDNDLNSVNLSLLRQKLGVVLQNSSVMPGSILDNIVGSSLLTIDDAWEAAEMTGLKEDIEAMPMGMFTVLSESGSTISGGQKQRIIISRAIVRKPSILLFDEATSALDNKTQSTVSKSLEQLQSTRIVIAHRLSTIRNADRIIVLKDGEIVESGDYDALIQNKGEFYNLAKRQIA